VNTSISARSDSSSFLISRPALIELLFGQHVARSEARRPLQRHAHHLDAGQNP
jgi:hypothetical protein